MSGETATLLRALWRGEMPDWPAPVLSEQCFLEDVDAQGMGPMVRFQLDRLEESSTWPPGVLEGLRQRAIREAAAEMARDAELEVVLQAFAEEGIQALLLKGAALSHVLYPRPGLRPRCDTDLLVAEAHRDAAGMLMKNLGFRPLHEARVDQISAQMSWFRPGRTGVGHTLDVHWRISNNDRRFSREFAHERLLQRAVAVDALGEHARTLAPADALLLACMHRAGHFSHSGDRLIWLHDIHLLAGSVTDTGLARFHGTVKALGLESVCGDALRVARYWFATRLPQTLEAMCNDTEGKGRRGYLRVGRPAGIRGFVLRELGSMPWSERIRYIYQNLFPPPAYMRWRYASTGRVLLPWLYFRRLLQGVRILVGRW